MGPGTHPSPKPTPAPAATKPAAPAAPCTPNKPVSSGAGGCPIHGKKRCEAKEIDIKVKYEYVNDSTQSAVETHFKADRQFRFDPIGKANEKKLGYETTALLKRYDLVIEALAGFVNKANEEAEEKENKATGKEKPQGTKVETKGVDNMAAIEFEGEIEGDPECEQGLHPQITMDPHTPTAQEDFEYKPEVEGHTKVNHATTVGHGVKIDHWLRTAEWKPGIKKVEVKEILAPSFKQDLLGGNSPFAGLFRFVAWLFHINSSLDIEMVLHACGVRSPHEAGVLNLNALVRVFRDVNAAIGIKIPPHKQLTYSAQGKYDSEGAKLLQETTRQNFGGTSTTSREHARGESPTWTKAFGGEPGEAELYFKFNELEFNWTETKETIKDGYEKAEKGWEKAKHAAHSAQDKLAKWDPQGNRKLAAQRKAAMGTIAYYKDKIIAAFKAVTKAIEVIMGTAKTLMDLMKKAPQLGFRLTCDLQVLAGNFFVSLGRTTLDSSAKYTGPLSNRYAPLFHKIHLEGQIQLFVFKLEASFGLFIDGGKIGSAEATVAGTITFELKYSQAVELAFGAGWQNSDGVDMTTILLAATAAVNLRARVQVTIAWKTWKREIGIESGIVAEGRVDVYIKVNKQQWLLDVRTLETGWYFISSDFKTGEVHVNVHKIWDARPLWFETNNAELRKQLQAKKK